MISAADGASLPWSPRATAPEPSRRSSRLPARRALAPRTTPSARLDEALRTYAPESRTSANAKDGSLDLEAYFARIGYAGDTAPTAATLEALHRDHVLRIPFENLDILLGRALRLDPASLEAKLIRERRGGYCFEQNGLFAAVLEKLGFTVTRLAARARFAGSKTVPGTHMLLRVEADGVSWLADVGFGGWGLIEPIPLEAGRETLQGVWRFRLRREGEVWSLECPECPAGAEQFAFTLEPQAPVDFEPANHYCATHPDSRFSRALTVQLPSPTERKILHNRELIVEDAQGTHHEHLASESALLRVLDQVFGLHLPSGTRFRPTMDEVASLQPRVLGERARVSKATKRLPCRGQSTNSLIS